MIEIRPMNHDSDPHEILVEYIHFYERTELKIVQEDKARLDFSSDVIREFIIMFNESLILNQRERVLWLMLRYGAPNNFKLLLEWIHNGLATSESIEKLDNLAQSQENIISFLLEQGLLQIPDIQKIITVLQRREFSGYPNSPRKLLEFHLKKIQEESKDEINSKTISNQAENSGGFGRKNFFYKDGASITKLALLLYFENKYASNHDFEKVSKDFGYENGLKLGKTFSKICDKKRRYQGAEGLNSEITIQNRIIDFEWVLKRLPEDRKGKAEDELKALKTRLISEK